ncbi:Iron-sulfur clusters transporter atm1, mitochondrial, partial [Coemansia helicoidea]
MLGVRVRPSLLGAAGVAGYAIRGRPSGLRPGQLLRRAAAADAWRRPARVESMLRVHQLQPYSTRPAPGPLAATKAPPPRRERGAMTKSGAKIILSMVKYVWPRGDWATKSRVIAALALMLGSKALNVQVPIIFKGIVDALNVDLAATGGTLSTVATAMLIGYGAARLGAAAFQELRNAIFASVQQNAVRNLALNVYRHLLDLDMRFHLSRETGGLTRAIDRGTKGISFILSSLVVHLVPTLLEIGIVAGILAHQFGPQYAVVTVATMAAYIVFTLAITQWRTRFRRAMN